MSQGSQEAPTHNTTNEGAKRPPRFKSSALPRKDHMSTFEHPREADTPEKMRAEISRLRRENAIVHNAMTAADVAGFSGEDRYTFLAYHALVALVNTQEAYHKHIMRTPAQYFVMPNTEAMRHAAKDER